MKVVDGEVWWNVLSECKGWKLEQHKLTGHCRIIDPDKNRVNFGKEAKMRALFKICVPSKTLKIDNDELVYSEFRRLIDEGEIKSRLADQPSTNIEWGTMGGTVFWDDLIEYKDWRIQQNRIFKNCRVLSPDDTRYAWGCKSYVFRRIMRQPINYVVGYINNPETADQHFMHYPLQKTNSQGIVILIHGWGCQAKNMEFLAKGLNQFGYDALCYDYRSSRQSIPDLAEELLNCLAETIEKIRNKKIFLLTHSMGGLLVRKMLELDRNDRVSSAISGIVMLGPPNQGSLMADIATLSGIGTVNKSIKDMRLWHEAEVHKIGRPAIYSGKIGIIAGIWDFKVIPQSSVEIPGMTCGIDYELIKVNTSHPGLKRSYDALCNAVYYFQHGLFPVQKDL